MMVLLKCGFQTKVLKKKIIESIENPTKDDEYYSDLNDVEEDESAHFNDKRAILTKNKKPNCLTQQILE